ncbi:hypothetical protein D5S19_20635 [Amycolatopsis panacis]|uniref:Uncharacterized protein n=1 Tax=Amycolatopsis panacis TaxID=2340917 RepID=A0A419I0G3_9PSEU|nr:hypothetical protein D5S19_20635 [Amycolatopsis panacis]
MEPWLGTFARRVPVVEDVVPDHRSRARKCFPDRPSSRAVVVIVAAEPPRLSNTVATDRAQLRTLLFGR